MLLLEPLEKLLDLIGHLLLADFLHHILRLLVVRVINVQLLFENLELSLKILIYY